MSAFTPEQLAELRAEIAAAFAPLADTLRRATQGQAALKVVGEAGPETMTFHPVGGGEPFTVKGRAD